MKQEELELAGLRCDNPPAILDTEEKVERFRDELERKIEIQVKKWETAKRDSQQYAKRLYLS